MDNNNQNNHKIVNEDLIKFVLPRALKEDLMKLANDRNISMSSLLRLVTTDYVKRNKTS